MYMSLTIHAKGFVCLTILRQFCIREKEKDRVKPLGTYNTGQDVMDLVDLQY